MHRHCTCDVTLRRVRAVIFAVFLTLTEVFPCFFHSCKANARVKLAKTGHGPHSSTLVVICVVRLLFVLFYVLFVCKCVLPPGDNRTAVNKYIISSYQFLKFILFWNNTLHVSEVFPSIIRSLRLYIQQKIYVKHILLTAC